MKTSQKGINLIKGHETLRLKAYLCPAGVLTIGYGHTKGVKDGDTITEQQAEQFLKEDLAEAEDAVLRTKVALNQNQFDALVSFVFNVGASKFNGSTLKKKLLKNASDKSISNEFSRWIYSKGEKLNGLVKRREDEATLYFS
ncbi:MAG: lysozyme [Bacteroidales bacterium]|nr:lysozyme [Bacteroidales bacterium]MBN2749922.1 lysozyme [Bacteroidales bacterium]